MAESRSNHWALFIGLFVLAVLVGLAVYCIGLHGGFGGMIPGTKPP